MPLSIQDTLQRALGSIQRKLFDMNVQVIGSGDTHAVLLQITEDKYEDQTVEVIGNTDIYCRINFPGQEVPLPQTGDTNTTASNNVLHLYDILPITGFFKFADNVKKGNVILYKQKIGEDQFDVMALQLLERIGRSSISDVVYIEWNLAPITNWELANSTAYLNIVETIKTTDNW